MGASWLLLGNGHTFDLEEGKILRMTHCESVLPGRPFCEQSGSALGR